MFLVSHFEDNILNVWILSVINLIFIHCSSIHTQTVVFFFTIYSSTHSYLGSNITSTVTQHCSPLSSHCADHQTSSGTEIWPNHHHCVAQGTALGHGQGVGWWLLEWKLPVSAAPLQAALTDPTKHSLTVLLLVSWWWWSGSGDPCRPAAPWVTMVLTRLLWLPPLNTDYYWHILQHTASMSVH